MKTTLVVMAAGMGSRFGGLKQAAPITESGRGILDFSIFDAKKAGFDQVVFIIRKEIEDDFIELVGKRIEKMIPVSYVLQDMSILPEGRKKPFGTAQAILNCKDIVNTPFAIINADDYYGRHAFESIHEHLLHAKNGEYCMVAYQLDKTLSNNGVVNRGVCQIKDGYLNEVVETLNISSKGEYTKDDVTHTLPLDTPVSMNLWGLTPDFFPFLEKKFNEFLSTCDRMKDELVIADVIFDQLKEKTATCKVYHNADKWCGITYKEDLGEVREILCGYIKEGYYPGF